MDSTDARTSTRLGVLLLVAAVGQFVAPTVQALLDVSQPADGSEDLLITPAGWAFSIWGLIYALALAHAVVTVWRGDGVGNGRFVLDLAVLYIGATIWIAVSATGVSWATSLVLLLMTWFAVDAARIAAHARRSEPRWIGHLARATSGLYAGWVSAAVFLNLGTAALELDLFSAEDRGWQFALLVTASVFAFCVNLMLPRSPGYAAAVVWALVGISAAVAGESRTALVVALVAIVVLVAQTVWSWTRVLSD